VSIRMFTITIWHVAKVVSSHHGEPAKVPNVYFGAFLLFKSALDSAQAHCRGLPEAAVKAQLQVLLAGEQEARTTSP
jgi:hypothetical protein